MPTSTCTDHTSRTADCGSKPSGSASGRSQARQPPPRAAHGTHPPLAPGLSPRPACPLVTNEVFEQVEHLLIERGGDHPGQIGQLAAIATPQLDLDQLLDANLTFHGILVENDGDRTRMLADQLRQHLLRPIIAEVFPPARTADAHRRLDTGHSGGKLVLQFHQEP
jgi:hypothetical protein